MVVFYMKFTEVFHARWLHRAQFLSKASKLTNVSIYLSTTDDKELPYLSFIFGDSSSVAKFSDLTKGVYLPHTFPLWDKVIDYLERENLSYFSGRDFLLEYLESQEWFLWKDDYCNFCSRLGCSSKSTDRYRCHRSAFIIGALDPIETFDIYDMYKKNNENIHSCFRRIEKHESLENIIELARPRWPDAIFY